MTIQYVFEGAARCCLRFEADQLGMREALRCNQRELSSIGAHVEDCSIVVG